MQVTCTECGRDFRKRGGIRLCSKCKSNNGIFSSTAEYLDRECNSPTTSGSMIFTEFMSNDLENGWPYDD